jgi:hypothetical protein
VTRFIVRAEGKARELLDELVQRGEEPGPMVRAMATARALLRGYRVNRSGGRANSAAHTSEQKK